MHFYDVITVALPVKREYTLYIVTTLIVGIFDVVYSRSHDHAPCCGYYTSRACDKIGSTCVISRLFELLLAPLFLVLQPTHAQKKIELFLALLLVMS